MQALKRVAVAWAAAIIAALTIPFLRHGILSARDQGDWTTALMLVVGELVLAMITAVMVGAAISWEALTDD